MVIRHMCGAAAAVLAVAVAASGLPLAAAAADDTAKLVDEIRALIERGERERLADPWYLKDLRAAVDRYDDPWRSPVLDEDFSARGPAPPPPWRVLRGDFRVDWRHGLRAVVGPAAPDAAPAPAEPARREGKDAAAAIIGALMQQALSGNAPSSSRDAGTAQQAPSAPAQPAFAAAAVNIPNAFSVTVEFSLRPLAGVAVPRLELGPYQGASVDAGYRLVHESGASPSFTLLSATARRVATVEIVDRAIDLADGAPHRLEWTRDRGGRMRVSLDGVLLMDVTDRRFGDPFDGLAVLNAGGDFALRRVRVDGAR